LLQQTKNQITKSLIRHQWKSEGMMLSNINKHIIQQNQRLVTRGFKAAAPLYGGGGGGHPGGKPGIVP
jgi:hypothetical protein